MTTEIQPGLTDRRTFLKAAGSAAVALGTTGVPVFAQPATPIRFGVDMFSLNAAELDAVPAARFRRQVEREGRALQRDPLPRIARARQPAQASAPAPTS